MLLVWIKFTQYIWFCLLFYQKFIIINIGFSFLENSQTSKDWPWLILLLFYFFFHIFREILVYNRCSINILSFDLLIQVAFGQQRINNLFIIFFLLYLFIWFNEAFIWGLRSKLERYRSFKDGLILLNRKLLLDLMTEIQEWKFFQLFQIVINILLAFLTWRFHFFIHLFLFIILKYLLIYYLSILK